MIDLGAHTQLSYCVYWTDLINVINLYWKNSLIEDSFTYSIL